MSTPLRIAHITDLHIERRPRLDQCFNKRAVGAVNLYVLGRKGHFDEASAAGLVSAVTELAPDAVVCTGDLTATATEQEFEAARTLLGPLIERFPFVVLPGNHDVYTGESRGRFATWFGAHCDGGTFPHVASVGAWDFVCLDTARPALLSRGRADPDMLARLDTCLAEGGDRPALLLVHYPLRNRHGAPYGPSTRNLEGAAALEGVLARHPRVQAVLHGHEHHGYRTEVPLADGRRLPSFDPGASGYAWLPDKRRTAHFNLYTLDERAMVAVARHAWNGERFLPEVGGAYATGG